MRKYTLYIFIAILVSVVSSCDNFLDTLPDNRTELTSKEKVAQLLVSAYPTVTYVQMTELMSDNVADNGPLFNSYDKSVDEAYLWDVFSDNQQDTPQALWDGFYKAIAAANHALEYIDKHPDDKSLLPYKGEALICRAYCHFILVNVFCQHYNSIKPNTNLGIPYVTTPEKTVLVEYDRETVEKIYDKINKDIEEGLPLINDLAYKTAAIKYHFNQKAAYAFAARFNLYYESYEQAVRYATLSLGTSPSKTLRDQESYKQYASSSDCGIAYVKENLKCNLLLMPAVSMWNYNHTKAAYCRYAHNMDKLEETLWGPGPWFNSLYFIPGDKIYGKEQYAFYPKLHGFLQYNDIMAGTGYLNIVNTVFTTDETLLCRAEANVMLKNYTEATNDLSMWYRSHTTEEAPDLTESYIESYYSKADIIIKPMLNPGFLIEDGKQTNFIHCVLNFRRCETLHEGLRWFDIKRFGIEIVHNIHGQNDDILTITDLRRAVQIPADVISAGMIANPR